MKFDAFISKIKPITEKSIGGLEAQFELAPEMRIPYSKSKIQSLHPKLAAVLCLFYPDGRNNTMFLLTLRPAYNGTHSSQISFPGGKIDKSDGSLENTALREVYEEVGVKSDQIEILRKMTEVYIPPSNFLVSPFLGVTKSTPKFITNHEVEEIIEVSLDELMSEKSVSSVKIDTSYAKSIDVPCFLLEGHVVWGATAMMLNEIKDLIRKI